MKKREFTLMLSASLFLAGNISKTMGQNFQKEQAERPNIIFVLTDDQRWDALGYAGNKFIETPEMDKLAEEGVCFRNGIVTTPICSASRSSIFTGLHERTHKYTFQTGPIRSEFMEESYPVLLNEAGYYTGFFGKFGVNFPGKESLFDVIEDYDRNGRFADRRGYFYKTLEDDTVHLTRYTGEKALDFIEHAPGDKPFCLSLSFSAPHAHDPAPKQYFWQEEYTKLYQEREVPPPHLGGIEWFNKLPRMVREGFNRTRWFWKFDTPEKYQHCMKGYYRMIYGIDREISKIRNKLEEKGLADNTVIILMGDNGYFLGERQLAGKWLMYDNSIRVPFIVFDPRVKKHKDIDDMALNIDVPATIAGLAGIDPPESWQGKSLVPVVSGAQKGLSRDTILIEHLWEFENIPPSEGVRTDKWKYFRYVNDQSIEELYNLKRDPRETKNLAGEKRYQKVLLKLRDKCDRLTQRYADPYSGVPSGLMVEYIREPGKTFINDKNPEFSWIVPDEALVQKAFQVLVSSTKESIDNNIGDLWDSQTVQSNQSSNIEYSGSPLEPHSAYYWKVRIYDQDYRLSAYSEAQKFRTGAFEGTVSSKNFFQMERIAPVAFKKLPDGHYFIDFGKDAFGTLELDYDARKEETLIIRLGEKLKNGRIDRQPGGTIRYQEVKLPVEPGRNHYTLSLPPDKRNTLPIAVQLPDSFDVVLPFRYCEIENAGRELTQEDVRQKAFFHYFDNGRSSFSSSDTVLNQVWDICKYTMKGTSFAGIYIDGDRERIAYEGDAYINQLGHYSTDREYAMAKQTIEYFMDHPTWPTEWQLHIPMMVYQDYLYSGDTELMEAYYPELKHKSLMDLVQDNGLISTQTGEITGSFMEKLGFADSNQRLRDLVDWPAGERDGHEMMPINTVVNSFYYKNMKIMAEIAGLLNRPEDQMNFQLRAAKAKKAINEKLFDPEKGIYVDGEGAGHSSIHSNMLPLAFDIVPDKHEKSVTEFVKSRGMACSVYGAQFLLEGLYKAGEDQYALDLMRSKEERSWWNMIEAGSTMTMEAWDMKYKGNLDWNHAWGAVPANIIPRFLWGIRPAAPGFGVVRIHPQMGDLKSSSIKIPTLKGPVKGKYQAVNPRLKKYTINLPANMTGEFVVEQTPQTVVRLNGETVNRSFKTVRLKPGKNEIEIGVHVL